MSIPDFTLLLCRQFLELLDTQAESEGCKCDSTIAPILDPHGSVKLESVHGTKHANVFNLDLGNHLVLQAKRKAVTSEGRPILCASSSVVAGEYITDDDRFAQQHQFVC
ncbi:hypothetical protein [Agrobacterium salinitolerans]|uniref:hypothetical protein n=1 Tax=Agrobacterium salinitolerans TaxID=1183413 RepID=UPI0013F59802|nr:hypothetical protein [Agrobacterium salinitolerans]